MRFDDGGESLTNALIDAAKDLKRLTSTLASLSCFTLLIQLWQTSWKV
jgi:hypothetical protein